MEHKLNSLTLTCMTAALAGGIFALDLWFPLGVAVGGLYVIPVLLSMWSSRRRFTFLGATGGSVLTLLGFFLTPLGAVAPLGTAHLIGIGNRALSLATIWATATGVHRDKRAEATLLQTACTTDPVVDEGWWVCTEPRGHGGRSQRDERPKQGIGSGKKEGENGRQEWS